MHRMLSAVPLIILLLAARNTPAEEWPQFRGLNASGVSTESKNLPIEFSYQEKVLWSAKLGEGIACPVVSRGKVFATAMVDEQEFAVSCFDAKSGKQLWR